MQAAIFAARGDTFGRPRHMDCFSYLVSNLFPQELKDHFQRLFQTYWESDTTVRILLGNTEVTPADIQSNLALQFR